MGVADLVVRGTVVVGIEPGLQFVVPGLVGRRQGTLLGLEPRPAPARARGQVVGCLDPGPALLTPARALCLQSLVGKALEKGGIRDGVPVPEQVLDDHPTGCLERLGAYVAEQVTDIRVEAELAPDRPRGAALHDLLQDPVLVGVRGHGEVLDVVDAELPAPPGIEDGRADPAQSEELAHVGDRLAEPRRDVFSISPASRSSAKATIWSASCIGAWLMFAARPASRAVPTSCSITGTCALRGILPAAARASRAARRRLPSTTKKTPPDSTTTRAAGRRANRCLRRAYRDRRRGRCTGR